MEPSDSEACAWCGGSFSLTTMTEPMRNGFRFHGYCLADYLMRTCVYNWRNRAYTRGFKVEKPTITFGV